MSRSTVWHSGLLLLLITSFVQVLAQASVRKQAVTEVPFELIRGEIVVPVTVNGSGPFWMLLDTGVDPSVVDLGTAKRVGSVQGTRCADRLSEPQGALLYECSLLCPSRAQPETGVH